MARMEEKTIHPLRATSFDDLFRQIKQAREILVERGGSPRDRFAEPCAEIWYRGMSSMHYKLQPSLLRFQDGLSIESQLYTEYIEHRAPENRDWQTLYEMQHYFIPTRLLDWTSSVGVALHFALNDEGALDNPSIWVLHPGMLNARALTPGALREVSFPENQVGSLTSDDLRKIDLEYSKVFLGKRMSMPRMPIATTPEAAFSRLRAQRGRFTVHGSDPAALEEQYCECLQKIIISNSAVEEIKEHISLTGIDHFSIFPDAIGLADHLRRHHGLSRMTKTKLLITQLRGLWSSDIEKLEHQNDRAMPTVSISGIENCAIRSSYLKRNMGEDGVEHELELWIRQAEGGFCIVTGDAGSGKTNCLFNLVVSQKLYENRPVIWFPLFRFSPRKGVLQSIHEYLHDILEKPSTNFTMALTELLRRSDTILILDGLDELSRTKGRRAAKALADALVEELQLSEGRDPLDTPKILISCRRDIYGNLEGDLELDRAHILNPIEPLPKEAISQQLGNVPHDADVLSFLAQYPIFLRFMRGRSPERPIPTKSSKFFALLMGAPERTDDLTSLGQFASRMLKKRQDFLDYKEFKEIVNKAEIEEDRFFQSLPMQALLKERNSGDVRFLHHTIREFVLAWNVHHSLTSPDSILWDLLLETSNLDYEGAEVHRAISELDPPPEWENVKRKWQMTEGWISRNNFAWCSFETAGMLGVKGAQRVILLNWIFEVLERAADGKDVEYYFNVKYNAARCLERLHSSAPECYWAWILEHHNRRVGRAIRGADGSTETDTPNVHGARKSDDLLIYGHAVRGFQRSHLGIGRVPPLMMRNGGARGGAPKDDDQVKFSGVLVKGIEFLASYVELGEGQLHVLVNMTYALIRWYSSEHKERIQKILSESNLKSQVRANLSLSLWYWHPEIEDDQISVKDGKVWFGTRPRHLHY